MSNSLCGTRIAGLTAASVALAAAGIPMRDMVVGCTAGKIEAMQKGKVGSLSIDEIKNAISISLKVGSALRETYIR